MYTGCQPKQHFPRHQNNAILRSAKSTMCNKMTHTKIAYSKAKYLKSATNLDQLPPDEGWEIAFIGRSNSGKSSALNTITGIKGLARTSSTPGRTQMINLFAIDDHRRLVDLPGYGYAKAPRTVRERWERTTDQYLQNRRCLRGLVLIMDIRHPLKDMDQQLIAWATSCGVSIHILLSKADKLTFSALRKTVKEVSEKLELYGDAISVQAFSSMERTGLDEAKEHLDVWFSEDE